MSATWSTIIDATWAFARFVVLRTSWTPATENPAKMTSDGRTWKNAGCVFAVPTNRFVDAFPSIKANPKAGGRIAFVAGETSRRPTRRFTGHAIGAMRAVKRRTTARKRAKASGARTSERKGRSTAT